MRNIDIMHLIMGKFVKSKYTRDQIMEVRREAIDLIECLIDQKIIKSDDTLPKF